MPTGRFANPLREGSDDVAVVRQVRELEKNQLRVLTLQAKLKPAMRVVVDDAVYVDPQGFAACIDGPAVQSLLQLLGRYRGPNASQPAVERHGPNPRGHSRKCGQPGFGW